MNPFFVLYLLRNAFIALMILTIFVAPLYSIHNSAPNNYYSSYTVHCHYIHATVANTDCPVFYGLSACAKALDAINYGTCGVNGSYIVTTKDFNTVSYALPIYLSVIIATAVFASLVEWLGYYIPHRFPKHFQQEKFRQFVVYLHHFIMLPTTILLMVTMDETNISASYAHQSGYNQRPQYGPSFYIVSGIVIIMLFIDNACHDIRPPS